MYVGRRCDCRLYESRYVSTEITCPPPSIPKSGRIVEQTNRHHSGRKQHQQQRTRAYKVGALVRFACLPGHQLLGEASIICTENGTWSHPSPVCKFSLCRKILVSFNLFLFCAVSLNHDTIMFSSCIDLQVKWDVLIREIHLTDELHR